MNLNEKLAELRKAKGLTQQEIAEALNVSRQAVSRWEVGTASPSLDNLAYLSRLYGVPLDDFVQEEAAIPAEKTTASPPERPDAVLASAKRPYTALVCAFLAVLILGVGILIGVSMQRRPEKEVYLYPRVEPENQIVVGDLESGYVPAWLEKTPADAADEAKWLEEAPLDIFKEVKTVP